MNDLKKYFKQLYNLKLTESQDNAIERIDNFINSDKQCFILKGYAGTGKTTLLHSLSRYLNDCNQTFFLMASTGRAAKVVADKTGMNAYTIHKSIYSMNDLKEDKIFDEIGTETFKYYFNIRNNDNPTNTIYIIDESSMISNHYSESEFFRFGTGHLLNDLFKYIGVSQDNINRKIIFIGDSAQLPPVNMSYSPALDIEHLNKILPNLSIDEFEMTDVVRQTENSGILNSATSIRKQINEDTFHKLNIETCNDDIIEIRHSDIADIYINRLKESKNDIIIISYSNNSVQNYNQLIRNRIFKDNCIDIQLEDKILIVKNNYHYGLLNGEFAEIKKIYSLQSELITVNLPVENGKKLNVDLRFRDVCITIQDRDLDTIELDCKVLENLLDSKERQLGNDEQRALYVLFRMNNKGLKPGTSIFKEAIRTDKYFNALQIKYGYAITCHKAQGGEWLNSIIDFKTSQSIHTETYFRWIYTAITRCKKQLYSISNPSFSQLSKIKNKEKNDVESIDINNVFEEDKINIPQSLEIENKLQKAIFKMVSSILDPIYKVDNIQHFEFFERYHFEKDEKNSTVDIVYNKKNKISNIRANVIDEDTQNLVKNFNGLIGRVLNINVFENNDRSSISFPVDKGFLQDFYNEIKLKLNNSGICISKIDHNQYQEKYYFTRNDKLSVILFYYNSKGVITRMIPEDNSSNSDKLKKDVMQLIQ
jgi:hypothetical protein